MRYFRKVVGENVYLSPINPDDAEIYTKWINDWDLSQYITLYPNVYPLAKERRLLENLSETQHYAIVRTEDDVMIGNCGFGGINHINRTAELGIFIGDAENRGRGYGTEALKLLIRYGFSTLNLRNIMLKVYADNDRAYACYKKVGFREFGRRTGEVYVNGKYLDTIYMEILNL